MEVESIVTGAVTGVSGAVAASHLGGELNGTPPDLNQSADVNLKPVPTTEADIQRTAQFLFGPIDSKTECIELRVFPTNAKLGLPMVAYAVDKAEFVRLATEANEWNVPVFSGVNPRQLARYSQAPGAWTPAEGNCSNNEHVTRRIWLCLDCNPVREAGFEEYNASHAERIQMGTPMKALVRGLPGSIARVDSGNGQCVLVRVEMENTQEVEVQVERFVSELQTSFNGPHLKLNSTSDAAYLMKVAGTSTFGKQSTPDRPTRASTWMGREMTPPVNDTIRGKIVAVEAQTATQQSAVIPQSNTSAPPASGKKVTKPTIDIAKLLEDCSTQCRVKINWGKVRIYTALLKSGFNPFPPVIVYQDGDRFYVADGFHRLYAAREAGMTTFPVEIRKGTKRDAMLFAVEHNAKHGLSFTNEDKRKAVRILLADSEWSKWSLSEIARRCGVTVPLVSKLSNDPSLKGLKTADAQRLFTRNGKTHSMTTGRIGKGKKAKAAQQESAPINNSKVTESSLAHTDQPGVQVQEAVEQVVDAIACTPTAEVTAVDVRPETSSGQTTGCEGGLEVPSVELFGRALEHVCGATVISHEDSDLVVYVFNKTLIKKAKKSVLSLSKLGGTVLATQAARSILQEEQERIAFLNYEKILEGEPLQ